MRVNDKIPEFFLGREYRLLRHAALQAVLLIVTDTMLWDEPGTIFGDRLPAWALYFLQVNVAVYGNMCLLVPRLLIKRRTVWYFVALMGLILVSILGVGAFQPASENPAVDNANQLPSLLAGVSSIVAFVLFILGLTALQLLKYRLDNIRRIEALKQATAAVELANLRNLINPHFLFNMLNNANIMAGEDVEKPAFILTKLNELLRYQIEVGGRENIRLADDIAFLDDYLALEKLRRDRFEYTISVDGDTDIELPPLLFIPFVENAVKHNPESGSFIHINDYPHVCLNSFL
jgi:sensor histidine kinase YesM